MGLFFQNGEPHHEQEKETEFKRFLETARPPAEKVHVVDHGIGHIDGITGIFCDHISDALDVIPL